jgi:hypothetical protein
LQQATGTAAFDLLKGVTGEPRETLVDPFGPALGIGQYHRIVGAGRDECEFAGFCLLLNDAGICLLELGALSGELFREPTQVVCRHFLRAQDVQQVHGGVVNRKVVHGQVMRGHLSGFRQPGRPDEDHAALNAGEPLAPQTQAGLDILDQPQNFRRVSQLRHA